MKTHLQPKLKHSDKPTSALYNYNLVVIVVVLVVVTVPAVQQHLNTLYNHITLIKTIIWGFVCFARFVLVNDWDYGNVPITTTTNLTILDVLELQLQL